MRMHAVKIPSMPRAILVAFRIKSILVSRRQDSAAAASNSTHEDGSTDIYIHTNEISDVVVFTKQDAIL